MSWIVATLLLVIVPDCLSFQRTSYLTLGSSSLQKAEVDRLIPLAVISKGNHRDFEQLRLGGKSNDLLEDSIDAFLRGDYDFAQDALSPLSEYSPKITVENAITSLRELDDAELSHGAAVLLRFCAPLSRGERWGGGQGVDAWKELLRGSLTPTMLSRRLQVSQFSGLLDFSKLDVMDGALSTGQRDLIGSPSFAFVNVALYFEGGKEPQLMEFKLVRNSGVWLIDSVKRSEHKLFSVEDSNKK